MEQPSTGYDFEVIGDMGKEFECPLCMLLLRKSVELPCAHVFCKDCLAQWQDNAMKKDAAFLCPSCKKVYQREQVADSKFLDKYVKTSLQVKCKENKSGCEWEGKIIDYTQHEEMCTYKSINCTLVGCKESVIAMNKAKHQTECVYRSVQCKYCLLEVQVINLKNHYGNCDEYPVNCPNDGCSIMTPRKEVCNHAQNECSYQIVNCEYNTVGCKHQLQRRLTCEHQTQCLPDHMNMLLNCFNTTSQELSLVKEKLRQTEERLQETEKRLQISEGKLSISDENHQETKILLNQTREGLQNTNEGLLETNELITKVINHDLEIDKICYQFAKCAKLFDVKVGLQSLATTDYNVIPEFNLHIADVCSDLHIMLEENLEVPYVGRFIHVMDIMETNKLYLSSKKEIFVKLDATIYENIYPYFTEYSIYYERMAHPDDIFSSKIILLRKHDRSHIFVEFSLPGWNNNNVTLFLLNPTENNPTSLRSDQWQAINKNMMTQNNTVLLKAVLGEHVI